MHHQYTILALDLARERSQEAAAARRAWHARAARAQQTGRVRRAAAGGLAAVARGAAAAVRRLDDCTADDLRRALSAQ
jgi:hypothetical protein